MVAYDKALNINPQLAGVWYIKGVTLDILGRYEEAIVTYNNAIVINLQYAGAWNNKGKALSRLGLHEEAKEAFEKAHEIDPTIMLKSNLPIIEQIPDKKLT